VIPPLDHLPHPAIKYSKCPNQQRRLPGIHVNVCLVIVPGVFLKRKLLREALLIAAQNADAKTLLFQ
jgi:hypothetical protein